LLEAHPEKNYEYAHDHEAAARTGSELQRWVVLHTEGRTDEERRFVDRLAHSAFGARMPYSVATLYARMGDTETAIRWLERAYETRQADVAMMKVAPELDPVRSDPRYADLVRRLGL